MKHTIRLLLMLPVAVWLSPDPIPALGAPPHTGIQGRATVCSPCGVFPGPPFPGTIAPVQTTVTIVSAHNGRSVAQVTTDSNGYFKIALPPGRYVLVPDSPPWPSEPELVCALLAAPPRSDGRGKEVRCGRGLVRSALDAEDFQ